VTAWFLFYGAQRACLQARSVTENRITAAPAAAFLYFAGIHPMGSPQVIPSNTLKSKPKFCLFYTHFISLDAAMNLIKLT